IWISISQCRRITIISWIGMAGITIGRAWLAMPNLTSVASMPASAGMTFVGAALDTEHREHDGGTAEHHRWGPPPLALPAGANVFTRVAQDAREPRRGDPCHCGARPRNPANHVLRSLPCAGSRQQVPR